MNSVKTPDVQKFQTGDRVVMSEDEIEPYLKVSEKVTSLSLDFLPFSHVSISTRQIPGTNWTSVSETKAVCNT